MGSTTIEFSVHGDSEGYTTFECPYCGSEFKLSISEFQDPSDVHLELYCPYCGLSKEVVSFYTKEIMETAQAYAYNAAIDMLNKAFGSMAHRSSQGKGLKITYKPLKKVTIKELKDKDTAEVEFQCKSCQHHVKVLYCSGEAKIFCPYCGVDL